MPLPSGYSQNVFINCPFDPAYKPFFDALVFAVIDCGYQARCALEAGNAGQVRVEKIIKIIRECKFGIHDISRIELTERTGLPRFNMPFELGLFLGALRFGNSDQRKKSCLILDADPYRYKAFISDIAGQDIETHDADPNQAITRVRNWLRQESGRTTIPGGTEIQRRYARFREDLPEMCSELPIDPDELTFGDYTFFVAEWLRRIQAEAEAVSE